jgi:pimeloyl-ACP methyl ester carboxylesterase
MPRRRLSKRQIRNHDAVQSKRCEDASHSKSTAREMSAKLISFRKSFRSARASSRRFRGSGMKILNILGFLAIAAAVRADDLPRKSKAPRESYPNVDVIYDSVTMPDGKRLRSIITKPRDAKEKSPVIFLAGWLSCDSVEAPADTKDTIGLILRGLAQAPGFCTFKIDKPGCGDSEGDCSQTDFDTELAGYRAAFRALKNYDFIDSNRVYIFGSSNGGGFAPLVPETESDQAQVRGYVTIGGWAKTWFEHMLDIERRRFALMKKSPGEVTDRIKGATTLYYEWLIKGRSVPDILKEKPELAELWPEGKDQTHLYGRPPKFYQDLQRLNLAAAWSRVKVPALIFHGQFDWIMGREDSELIAQIVNANVPGAARFIEVPEMGHGGQHYLSMADAFAGKEAPFDPKIIRTMTDWLEQQQKKSTR